jgi:hypothetical protein
MVLYIYVFLFQVSFWTTYTFPLLLGKEWEHRYTIYGAAGILGKFLLTKIYVGNNVGSTVGIIDVN